MATNWGTWLFKMRCARRRGGDDEFTVSLADAEGNILQTSGPTPQEAIRGLMSLSGCPQDIVRDALGFTRPARAPATQEVACSVSVGARRMR